MKIGVIGQGYVGKPLADYLERSHEVVRYSLENEYLANKWKIAECDVVFICVPTPTVEGKINLAPLNQAIACVGPGMIVVIKSTVLPGVTDSFQEFIPNRTFLYCPEFLSADTARTDTLYPEIQVIGLPKQTELHKSAAETVKAMLPVAIYSQMCTAKQAEFIKYCHNGAAYVNIVFFNTMFEMAENLGVEWFAIENALTNDSMIAKRYAKVMHKGARGAGGACFIKDFAALSEFNEKIGDDKSRYFMQAVEQKNINILRKSGKDKTLLQETYKNI